MGRSPLFWAATLLVLALGGCTEDAEAAERQALLHFRAGARGWEQLEAAAGPAGLPGWAADSPLHHCKWGGVACCSVSEDIADALGGSTTESTVCTLRLAYQPPVADWAAAAGDGSPPTEADSPRPAPAVDLEPLRELPWLAILELSGIAVSMSSVERLVQPRQPPLQLWSLVLREAALDAPLPPRLFQAPSLREVDLSFSGVQGPLPPQRHCALQHINLAGNRQLSGALPLALLLNPSNASASQAQAMSERGTTFCDLLHLNLSSTGLNGQLPELPAAAASSLATLDLSNTQLASTLPASWPFNTPYLFYLDLTNTSLRGAIPSSWWDDALSIKQLGPKVPEFLYFADNAFSGTVPLGWAAVLTPADTIRYRHEAVADSREIAELQARLASHGRVRMVELIKTRDAYVTVHRLRYRSEQHTLRTALFPGNERLCLQPDQTLRLVQDRVQNVPVYQTLLEQLCHGHGSKDRSMAAGTALLALMAALAAMVLLGAAYLRHGQLSKRWWQLWRWRRAGYVPAQMDGIASQQCSKEADWHIAAAAAAETGNALPLNVRPGRRMGAVLQAIELAQASARASGGSAAQHAYPSQQAELAQHEVLEDEGPQQTQQQQQQQQQQREQHLALQDPQQVPVSAGAEELPPLPLLPSTALVLPQHEGQPLMLGRTSRSMVMLGRLQGVGEVAVKALHISPQLLATARREVRLLRRCANRHPNLVHLHGLCHTHPFLLVVTELCAGGDLQSVLHLPEMRWHARGAQVALDVSRGVAFMHSQGVVWADCKPGNVLLTDSWRAKVTDLGTSRLLRGHSTAQSSATPAYAAPEQLLNGRVGLPSDVFSLGLLLHDLCTGEQPTLAVSGEGRACYRRPLAPGRDCPEAVARLIERCKAPLPADRPTAAAVVAALQSMTHG